MCYRCNLIICNILQKWWDFVSLFVHLYLSLVSSSVVFRKKCYEYWSIMLCVNMKFSFSDICLRMKWLSNIIQGHLAFHEPAKLFWMGLSIFHTYGLCMREPVSLHPHRHLALPPFFSLALQKGEVNLRQTKIPAQRKNVGMKPHSKPRSSQQLMAA